MREVPDCLNRRYTALDDLVQELSMAVSSQNFSTRSDVSNDSSIQVMCAFWNILKEDPDCNLTQAVKRRMDIYTTNSTMFGPRHVTCYIAGNDKKPCCGKDSGHSSKNVTPKSSRDKVKETDSSTCKSCSKDPKKEVSVEIIMDDIANGPMPNIPSKESSVITVPCKKPPSSVCCTDKEKKRPQLTSSRETLTIRVPLEVDPINRKLEEINDVIHCHEKSGDKTNKNKEVCCKRCLEKMKSETCSARSSKFNSGPETPTSPLGKALCNLQQAASYDKSCSDKIQSLLKSQTQLESQIQKLERREHAGLEMLKKADCMWTCMEECYKKKLEGSQQRQKELLKELKKVELNNDKWRKTNKDLEFQINKLNEVHCQTMIKINQRKNDMKVIDVEIDNLKKRITNYTKETANIKKKMEWNKSSSNSRISSYSEEINKLQDALQKEYRLKSEKEEEGAKYIQDARNDMQRITKILLQKKMQNEDLRAELKAVEEEIELLNCAVDQCRDKCSMKEKKMNDEIVKLTQEIELYQFKCTRCHQFTDTDDIRKLCTDCPRCATEKDCIVDGEHCIPDPAMDCVCQSVKQKFLGNVFENMYTVLARQIKTRPGKGVATVILENLKKSTNGKLNKDSRSILRDFILTTVKKNLNLTIVGGAVKTRCEMDSETYSQLMACLKDVKVVKPPTEDKGTAAKKASCKRWGGTSECNCPSGPKSCICMKNAPPRVSDPMSKAPPKAEDSSEVVTCPHKKETASCGVDCEMHGASEDLKVWIRDPCKSPGTCSFSSNMKAVQCMIGPESLLNIKMHNEAPVPFLNEEMIKKRHEEKRKRKPCDCGQDRRSGPRETIIEEVMGKYTEMSPIEKVSLNDDDCKGTNKDEKRCLRSGLLTENILREKPKQNKKCTFGSDSKYLDGAKALSLPKRDLDNIDHDENEQSSSGSKTRSLKNEFDVQISSNPIFSSSDLTNKVKKVNFTDHLNMNSRKTHISRMAKKLITDVIVTDVNREKYDDDPESERMTIDSLVDQISCATNLLSCDISSDSDDEINMDIE